MKIEFSLHAERQLQERNIKLREVEEILKNPDQIVEGNSPDKKIAQKLIKKNNKRFLYRVVFKKEDANYMVITAYRTTKIEKYMKEAKA